MCDQQRGLHPAKVSTRVQPEAWRCGNPGRLHNAALCRIDGPRIACGGTGVSIESAGEQTFLLVNMPKCCLEQIDSDTFAETV